MNSDLKPMPSRADDWLALLNPPLVLSAAAECLAGAYLGGASMAEMRPYALAVAAAALFAAGSLFSHYFDRAGDESRDPARPLPAARVAPGEAWASGCALLGAGVVLPLAGGRDSILAALGVAMMIVLYAAATKTVWGLNFLTLGAARGLNVLLGLSASTYGLLRFWTVAIPVTLYAIGWAILRASRQPGSPPSTGFVALVHIAAGFSIAFYQIVTGAPDRASAALFLVAALALTLPRLVQAVAEPRRVFVTLAVQFVFLTLPLLEAAIVAGHAGPVPGLLIALSAAGVYVLLSRWPIPLAVTPR